MRRFVLFIYLITFLGQSCTQKDNQKIPAKEQFAYTDVRNNFENPSREYGVNCWWWWLNGNVNKAAITKDLEAMKSKNFQGAMIFDAGGHNQRGNKDIPKGPLYGSDEWNELFVFALDEAKRLGLTMGFNIQSGWNLGGPRVTSEYAAKQLTFSETKVEGGKAVSLKLEQPFTRDDFYKDIIVLAFPLNEAAKTKEVITDLDYKLGFHELGGSAPDCRFLLFNNPEKEKPEGAENYFINKDEIVLLDAFVAEDGTLNWDAPAGNWNIMRIGYTCTDAEVSTSSGDWQGLVLDYMSKDAFDFYWNDVVEPIFEAVGDHVGTTLKYMETDSWECGGMNWTDKFAQEFTDYRGYDMLDYLPVVAGYIVDDVNTTNAFLSDFRKTLADLVAENHYKRFQEYAHKYNMGVQPESAGPHAGPMDGIKNYGYNDIVMSEFWAPSPHRPRDENRFFLKQASSAAHIYGIKIVGAESFTTIGPHWNDELWHDQKSSFDHEICAGLNRMYFHTFTCSPPEMGLPGQEYFAGTHVNPQVTWWNESGPFIDYMQRVQAVVQEGKFVADVLYYYGDHVPNVFPYKHSDPAGVMPGFDYDVTDETIFLQLKVKDGKVVVPGGIEYKVLVLPDHEVLSLAVLKKLEELINQGATVIGYKPKGAISLVGGDEAEETFKSLADQLWGNDNNAAGSREYGSGKVVWGASAREYLLSQGIEPDFSVENKNSKTDFDYIHYTIGEAEIYFVSNQTAEKQQINATFRVEGLHPELWDANTGDIRDALAFKQADGKTKVPLTLEPYESVMVVFNSKIPADRQGIAKRNYPDYKMVEAIDGEWELYFDPEWGGPGEVVFPELMDWSKNANPGIKYYSGKVNYTKTFDLNFVPDNGSDYFLQLETVKDVGIAAITINGKYKGITWTKPFRVDVTGDLKEGENTLEIMVVNSWFNRLAGDEILNDQKKYTSTNIVISNDYLGHKLPEIGLESSGLIGPVTIKTSVWEGE
ncbi:glycosyl hydrolase [Draconibacterium sp. IB214405]|uniref:glycosyl hydrolase n=1 Tax=Draconibacterium sp. IB214405 TaxID=3097352 RepID=UPI002A0EE2AD|nr:glycosyl hydrolase [Draconibacterium sp. IB214405]MDX8339342.1 glycosyl hydrolase [Draconibacterium sp. IB214405]